jgi:hypothetical protein
MDLELESATRIDDSVKFFILESIVELISSETAYGLQTVGVMDGECFYLGSAACNIETAINLWQESYGMLLSSEDMTAVMLQNKLTSQAV